MAAVTITVDKLKNVYDGFTAVLAHTLDAEGITFRSSGNEMIIIRHDGGAEAGTVVLQSTPDQLNRLGDIQVVLNSGDVKGIGPVKQLGFMDSSGMVTLKLAADISNTIVAYVFQPSS